GRRLFMEHGCVACHAEPGARDPHGREPLHGISTKWKPVALAEYLQNPRRHFAWTRMPDFGLGRSDAEALASWLFAADAAAGVGARGRADRGGHAPGDPVRGRQLTEAAGCFACHAMDGARPVGAGGPLAEVARGDWSPGYMRTDPDDRSPDFRFSAEEREVLRALREIGVVEALRGDAPAEFAERQIHNLRCHACHVRDG